jgi:S1-C subfamily serine protease
MTIEICKDDEDKMSHCSRESFYSVGSGSVVWHKNSKTYFLTAGHVCHAEVQDHLKPLVTNVEMQFKVQNIKNEYYNVKVANISEEYLNGNELDLCLLESDGIVSMPTLHVALNGPKVGEMVYNVAAPTGFFYPPTVPLLSGYHSGPLGTYHSLLTIPATGGSSGSPVINSDGELIGLIFAANTDFSHLAISIRYEVLKKYLQDNLYSRPSL